VHLACEQRQKPLAIVITAGQRGESPQFQVVLGRIRVPRPGGGHPRTRPDRVLADKACGSRGNRACLRRRGIRCTPSRTRPARSVTARTKAAPAADRPRSTRNCTSSVTPWNAGPPG
jgi:Transposase DDE domain